MAATRVSEDLDTVQTHINMRTVNVGLVWKTLELMTGAYLAGVNNSSHSSTPMHVSTVLITASPNVTLVWSTELVCDVVILGD